MLARPTLTQPAPVFEAPLVERREVAAGTMALRFDVSGRAPVFQAGQASDVTLPDGSTHAFAIASSPANPRTLMIAARMRDTRFGEALRPLALLGADADDGVRGEAADVDAQRLGARDVHQWPRSASSLRRDGGTPSEPARAAMSCTMASGPET